MAKLTLAFFAVLGVVASTVNGLEGSKPWMDPSKPIPERVAKLLKTLTVEQKITQTFATHTSEKVVSQFADTGVGAVKFMSAFPSSNMTAAVIARNSLQEQFLKACGVPASFINEGGCSKLLVE